MDSIEFELPTPHSDMPRTIEKFIGMLNATCTHNWDTSAKLCFALRAVITYWDQVLGDAAVLVPKAAMRELVNFIFERLQIRSSTTGEQFAVHVTEEDDAWCIHVISADGDVTAHHLNDRTHLN